MAEPIPAASRSRPVGESAGREHQACQSSGPRVARTPAGRGVKELGGEGSPTGVGCVGLDSGRLTWCERAPGASWVGSNERRRTSHPSASSWARASRSTRLEVIPVSMTRSRSGQGTVADPERTIRSHTVSRTNRSVCRRSRPYRPHEARNAACSPRTASVTSEAAGPAWPRPQRAGEPAHPAGGAGMAAASRPPCSTPARSTTLCPLLRALPMANR